MYDQRVKVLMVASEATPFAKTGGLADVIGALPPALAERGHEITVLLPLYRKSAPGVESAPCVYERMQLWLGPDPIEANIRRIQDRGVDWLFLECPPLFNRDELYSEGGQDYPDNHLRFGAFCYSALGVIRYLFRPQIVHMHDWQSALTAPLIRSRFAMDPTFLGLKLLFTIHNLGYQGIFPPSILDDLALNGSLNHPSAMEFFGRINLLKGAIVFSDAVSTVSRGYAHEIQSDEFGFGLQDLLRSRSNVLTGIVNGVDYREWNPETDPYLRSHYSVEDLDGKRECKRDLLAAFGLPEVNLDRPLIGIVSRFVPQKGFDLIAEVAPALAAEDAALVALGTGDPKYEQMLRDLAAAHPDRIAVKVAYDNELAHKIEAGADMFLMPSHYEPCGLNQIYSLRYGTPPIVRATGGLDDTIEEGTGFKFREYSGSALLQAVRAALAAWRDKPAWNAIMRRGMEKDFSWNASAGEYDSLYRRLAGIG